MPRRALFAILTLAALLVAAAVEAAGPYKGRIVDQETGQPIEGAVVVAIWWLRYPGPIHPGQSLHDVAEVVSDASGRFTIPAVRGFSFIPFTSVLGPELRIFKGGYGWWRFQGQPEGVTAARTASDETHPWFTAAWKHFERHGLTIELPPLRDPSKRRAFRTVMSLYGAVPDSRIPRYQRALSAETDILSRQPPHER